jgi:hypothetical protein
MTDEPLPSDAPVNLFESPPGSWSSHGRFGAEARRYCSTWTGEQRGILVLTTTLLGAGVVVSNRASDSSNSRFGRYSSRPVFGQWRSRRFDHSNGR